MNASLLWYRMATRPAEHAARNDAGRKGAWRGRRRRVDPERFSKEMKNAQVIELRFAA
jgi:hypothetical protein